MSEPQNKPIVIDVELKRGLPINSPPIAKKLSMIQMNETALTLDDIQEKLDKAEMNRKAELARKALNHTEEKRQQVLKRKDSLLMETQEKYHTQLEKKTEAAD